MKDEGVPEGPLRQCCVGRQELPSSGPFVRDNRVQFLKVWADPPFAVISQIRESQRSSVAIEADRKWAIKLGNGNGNVLYVAE